MDLDELNKARDMMLYCWKNFNDTLPIEVKKCMIDMYTLLIRLAAKEKVKQDDNIGGES